MKREMIFIMMIATIFLIGSCGKVDRLKASYTGHSKICIDNVEYIQFTSGATVAYTPDGKVKTCK